MSIMLAGDSEEKTKNQRNFQEAAWGTEDDKASTVWYVAIWDCLEIW